MAADESRLLAFGAASAALSRLLPPVIDGPFLRALRGAMIDRVARETGVTLTAEARRLLAELDDPLSARGRVEKGARWLVARVVPGLNAASTGLHLVSTFTVGALLRRYFASRPHASLGTVIDGFEATRVRRALKVALDFATAEHARGAAHALSAAGGAILEGARAKEGAASGPRTIAAQAKSALEAGAASLPPAWIDAIEPIFRREMSL
jgi:hypothetical protein